ncbi:MAG: lipopolysaccharide biosynthesis protein [Actinomycetota bacterium]
MLEWLMRTGSSPSAQIALFTAAGQTASFASIPLLLTIYPPDQFGSYAAFLASAVVLASVATLRFEAAIPLPSNPGIWRGLASCSLLSVGFFAASAWLVIRYALDAADRSVILTPALVAIMAANQVLTVIATRQERYRAIARRGLTQSVGVILAQLLLGSFWAPTTNSLLIGHITGQTLTLVTLSLALERPTTSWRLGDLRRSATRYWAYPATLVPSTLLNNLSLHSPVLLSSLYFGPEATGVIAIAIRVVSTPVSLISQSVATVYVARFSSALRSGDFTAGYQLFLRTTRKLILIALPGATVIALAAPAAADSALPGAWANAGPLISILALSATAQFIVSPTSQTLLLMGYPANQLTYDAARLIAVALSITAGAAFTDDLPVAIASFSGISALTYSVLWYMGHKKLRHAAYAPPV